MPTPPLTDNVRALATADAPPLPLPVFGGVEMAHALAAYAALQRALDLAMPDQIILLAGRPFRRKGFWRAVAVAFHVSVELVEERRDVRGCFTDGRENFGYVVVCRATAPNGRTAMGDGAVFAIEKARRDVADKWATCPAMASEHNVRSHAMTRAINRAISNLCGFGEVSAEEADAEEADAEDVPARPRGAASVITAKQQARLFTLARKVGWTVEGIRAALRDRFGIRNTAAITQSDYGPICEVFTHPPATTADADVDPPL